MGHSGIGLYCTYGEEVGEDAILETSIHGLREVGPEPGNSSAPQCRLDV